RPPGTRVQTAARGPVGARAADQRTHHARRLPRDRGGVGVHRGPAQAMGVGRPPGAQQADQHDRGPEGGDRSRRPAPLAVAGHDDGPAHRTGRSGVPVPPPGAARDVDPRCAGGLTLRGRHDDHLQRQQPPGRPRPALRPSQLPAPLTGDDEMTLTHDTDTVPSGATRSAEGGPLSRRSFMGLVGAGTTALGVTGLGARMAFATPASPSSGDVIVVVFMRGAWDGLSVVAPYQMPTYKALRPTIRIKEPAE